MWWPRRLGRRCVTTSDRLLSVVCRLLSAICRLSSVVCRLATRQPNLHSAPRRRWRPDWHLARPSARLSARLSDWRSDWHQYWHVKRKLFTRLSVPAWKVSLRRESRWMVMMWRCQQKIIVNRARGCWHLLQYLSYLLSVGAKFDGYRASPMRAFGDDCAIL